MPGQPRQILLQFEHRAGVAAGHASLEPERLQIRVALRAEVPVDIRGGLGIEAVQSHGQPLELRTRRAFRAPRRQIPSAHANSQAILVSAGWPGR